MIYLSILLKLRIFFLFWFRSQIMLLYAIIIIHQTTATIVLYSNRITTHIYFFFRNVNCFSFFGHLNENKNNKKKKKLKDLLNNTNLFSIQSTNRERESTVIILLWLCAWHCSFVADEISSAKCIHILCVVTIVIVYTIYCDSFVEKTREWNSFPWCAYDYIIEIFWYYINEILLLFELKKYIIMKHDCRSSR